MAKSMSNGKSKNNYNSQWPKDVGILAMELYFCNSFVEQSDFEEVYKTGKGKYTIGLGQEQMVFATDREDTNSICLTVTQTLMEKHSIDPKDVGFLMVGTETIIDKSKSPKTVLMDLFAESGNTDIEGLHTTNACYGGTAALFHAIQWIESSSWDGRYAIVVAADIALYENGPVRPTGGAGAVAMLLGTNAAIIFDRKLRSTYMANVYDFYKPDMSKEYPLLDGKLSIKCYLQALEKCFDSYIQKCHKYSDIDVDSFDAILFHVPYCKLVQKALARLILLDYLKSPDKLQYRNDEIKELEKWRNKNLEDTYEDKDLEKLLVTLSADLFEKVTKPSLKLAKTLGNSYTASLYTSLISYLLSKPIEDLANKRVLLYSYGSGLAASIFSAKLSENTSPDSPLGKLINGIADIPELLTKRHQFCGENCNNLLEWRERDYNRAPNKPIGQCVTLNYGTYYLFEVDDKFHRIYKRWSKGDEKQYEID